METLHSRGTSVSIGWVFVEVRKESGNKPLRTRRPIVGDMFRVFSVSDINHLDDCRGQRSHGYFLQVIVLIVQVLEIDPAP